MKNTDPLFKEIDNLLHTLKMWPEKDWGKAITVVHTYNEKDYETVRKAVRTALGKDFKASGWYMYVHDETDEIMYIGKANNQLGSRMYSHARKMFKNKKDARRHVFWRDRPGKLKIYWCKAPDYMTDTEITFLESALQMVFQPSYEEWMMQTQTKQQGSNHPEDFQNRM